MYITSQELTSQGITGDAGYLSSVVDRTEAIFNSLIWDDKGVLLQERTEELREICNPYEISLKYSLPQTITSINWVAPVSWEYKILWQKLIVKNALALDTEFPYLLTIVYEAWLSEVPNDIKQVCFSIASYFHNMKNSGGISSFTQDLLTVSYGAKEVYDYLDKMWESVIINKYKTYYAYSL